MSQFSAIDDVERAVRGVSEALPWSARAERIDAELVRPTRAAQPPGVEDKRATKRLSMAELNELDADEIRERLQRTGFDNRGPVTKFLDLIDAPRNFIAGRILTPALRKRQEAAGVKGAFGEGKVLFSDVLGEMGMRPGLARGVLGFVGDVALDPLTYAGPPGWGAKVVSKTGQVARVGLQGTRAARGGIFKTGAIKEVAGGGAPTDPLIRRMWEAAGKPDAAGLSEILGGPRVGGKAKKFVENAGLGEREYGGSLADLIWADPAVHPNPELVNAAKGYYARYGAGAPATLEQLAGKAPVARLTPKGIAFGNGQSAVGHIPFTEYGLYVPGFTAAARNNAVNRAVSYIKNGKQNAAGLLLEQEKLTREFDEMNRARASFVEDLDSLDDPEDQDTYREIIDNLTERMDRKRTEIWAKMSGKQLDESGKVVGDDPSPLAFADLDLNDMLTMKARADAAQAAVVAARAHLEGSELGRQVIAEMERTAAPGQKIAGVDMVKNARGYKKMVLDDSRAAVQADPEVVALKGQIEQAEAPPAATPPPPDLAPAPVKEHIVASAVQDSAGKTYSGALHAEAIAQFEAQHAPGAVLSDAEGFLTSTGRYVGREEAAKIAGLVSGKAKAEDFGRFIKDAEGKTTIKWDAPAPVKASSVPEISQPPDPATLRGQLYDLVEAKAAALRKQNLHASVNAVADMADADLEKMAMLADGHIKAVDAAFAYATATRGQLVNQLTSGQKLTQNVARAILNIDEEWLGPSVFGAFKTAAERVMKKEDGLRAFAALDAMAAKGRSVFGNRRAGYNQQVRYAKDVLEGGSAFETRAVMEPIIHRMNQVAAKYDIPRDRMDAFNALLMVKIQAKLDKDFPNRSLFRVVKDGELVDGPDAIALRNAEQAGFLDSKIEQGRYAKLLTDLDPIVDEYIALSRKMGEAADGAGMIGVPRQGYFPTVPTLEFSKFAAQQRAAGYGGRTPEAVGKISEFAEEFQRGRKSTTYLWQDKKTGKWRQMDETDFDIARTLNPPSTMSQPTMIAEKTAAEENLASFIDTYGKDLASPEKAGARMNLLGRNPSPIYMNQMLKDKYRVITGGAPMVDRMFTENALHAMAQRVDQQFNAQAKRSYLDMIERTALDTNERISEVINSPVGHTFRLSSGAPGTVLGNGRVKIGDVVYRKPLIELPRNESSLVQGVLDDQRLNRLLPEEVAEFVEGMAKAGSGDENVGKLLSFIDGTNKVWKGFTLLHPSWVIFNMAGLGWQAMIGRVPLDGIAKYLPAAYRIRMSNNFDVLGDRTVKVFGRDVRLDDLRLDIRTNHVGTPKGEEAVRHVAPGMAPRYPQDVGVPATRGQRVVGAFTRVPDAVRESLKVADARARIAGQAGGKATTAQKIGIGMQTVGREGVLRGIMAPWFAFNSAAEDVFRIAGYLALLDRGDAASMAAARVRDVFFDFGDMTSVERGVRRHLIPFYAWLRNNTAYQIRNVLAQPKYVGMLPKLKEAIEEAIAGEDQLPEHMRPTWLREQLAIQLSSDPESRFAVMAGTAVPSEPVGQFGGALTGGQGVQNLVRWFTSGIAPPFSIPLQIGAGREFFTGREIGHEEGVGDISAREFLLGQIRPLREAAPIGPRTPPLVRAAREGPGSFAARALLGGRSQPLSDERVSFAKEREYQERFEGLRRAVSIAEREGDKERSLQGRARLLAVYRQARQEGVKIPRWAENFLGAETAAR